MDIVVNCESRQLKYPSGGNIFILWGNGYFVPLALAFMRLQVEGVLCVLCQCGGILFRPCFALSM
jgi:hypothetical protein